MPVLSPVLNGGNSIGYSTGIKFKLNQVFEDGSRKEVILIKAGEENVFYGLFDVENTDFEIIVDNRSLLKIIRFELKVPNNVPRGFICRTKTSYAMKALEKNGRHLHFVSQSTDEGKILVAMTAHEKKISYAEAAVYCSRIRFSAEVGEDRTISQGKTITVQINNLTEKFSHAFNEDWTVRTIKEWYEKKKGILSSRLRILFNCRHLEDNQTLREVGAVDGSVLYFLQRMLGGADPPDELDVGERGVCCLAKETDQYFRTYYGFEASEEYELKPFTIELRMKSKYFLS